MKGIIVASNDIIDNKKPILCSAFAFSDLRFICNIIQNKNNDNAVRMMPADNMAKFSLVVS